MSQTAGPAGSGADDELSGVRLTRLLSLGFQEGRRPVDELLERLEQSGGEEWIRERIRKGPAAASGPPEERLAAGKAPLAELESIKEASKKLLKRSKDRDERLGAFLGYLLSIAAALAHHGKLISDRSREELDPLLLDLSAVLPAPWPELLARALKAA